MKDKEEFFLDEEGYYVTKELFRYRINFDKCPQCGNYMNSVYAERYLKFEGGIMMLMDIKIYGRECDSCNCGFINID